MAGTTLDDVKAAAGVSGSQMYHYFPDKDELVQAVIATRPTSSPATSGRPTSAAPRG